MLRNLWRKSFDCAASWSAPIAVGLIGALGCAPAAACGAALVLAIDVSSSVNDWEYDLIRRGHEAAFRDPELIDIVRSNGLRVMAMHWSGPDHQLVHTPWRALDTEADALAFAALLGKAPRQSFQERTALGSALERLTDIWGPEERACARRIIDVTADGVNNAGPSAAAARERLIADGVTLNALVVLGDYPNPMFFYEREVIGGPGAFMETALNFATYARAFRRKLLRELRPSLAALPAGDAVAARAEPRRPDPRDRRSP
ncbi:MAG: DUF1194 domain-containing protein [Pseudomonadota bacterium]